MKTGQSSFILILEYCEDDLLLVNSLDASEFIIAVDFV